MRVLVYRGAGPVEVAAAQGMTVEEDGLSPSPSPRFTFPPSVEPVSYESSRHWSVRSCGSHLQVDGRAYRGELEVYLDDGQVQVVNLVGLEDYLRGVVPRELLSSQLEAVKAQAVVARTYALAHRRGAGERWDVRDDVGHQVYGGVQAEHPTSDLAVRDTAGLVLAWNGRLASRVVYHSTCGGRTEANEYVFGTSPVPYLRGVECANREGMPACSASSYAIWTAEWSAAELGQEVGRSLGKPGPPIRGLEIREKSPSGRVTRLALLFEEGELELTGDDLRRVLVFRDPSGQERTLPSTRFEVLPDQGDGRIRIRGTGWGHGVGMCQWGAIGVAREGLGFEDVLQRYFPGTRVVWEGKIPDLSGL